MEPIRQIWACNAFRLGTVRCARIARLAYTRAGVSFRDERRRGTQAPPLPCIDLTLIIAVDPRQTQKPLRIYKQDLHHTLLGRSLFCLMHQFEGGKLEAAKPA